MNEKEIKDITKKSVVKAPHDFTDRLLYRIENEAPVSIDNVRVRIPYMVMGAMVFLAMITLITLNFSELSISNSSFPSSLFKRGFQLGMTIFFLVALQWVFGLIKESKYLNGE